MVDSWEIIPTSDAVRWPDQPPTLQLDSWYALTFSALLRAFSSHRQPSASLTKLFPSCNFLLHNDDKQTQLVTIVFNVNQL